MYTKYIGYSLSVIYRAQSTKKMSKKNKEILKVALGYFGAVVGAGFISGQELAQFFLRFGLFGIFGWFLTCILIISGGGLAIGFLAKKKYDSFDQLINKMYGSTVAKLANLISLGYLAGGLVIMMSGAGSLLSEMFGLPLFIGVGLISLSIYLTIIGKAQRLLHVKEYLVPLLIILAVFSSYVVLSAFNFLITGDFIRGMSILNPSILIPNWWVSVPLYIGYNAIGAIVGFINIAKETSVESGKKGGYLGGILVSTLGSILMLTLWVSYPAWQNAELPIISMIRDHVSWVYPIFAPSILIAMFTVASNYSLGISNYLKENTFKKTKFNNLCGILLLVMSPIALLGFSRLLGMIYPFFGIMATILVIWFLIQKRKNLLKIAKKAIV